MSKALERLQSARPTGSMPRQARRDLAHLEANTLVRMADAQSQEMVAKEKTRGVDHVVREAMTSQALLQEWAAATAGNNVVLFEELQFFTQLARMAKGQIIADLVDDYCRESARRGL